MTGRDERGSASVELVLLTPLLVGLLLVVTAFGRVAAARADVQAATRAAARAASLERSSPAAKVAAERAFLRELTVSGYRCGEFEVRVDTSNFRADGLTAVDAACRVDLSGVTGLGIPGSQTLSTRFSEVTDRYRGTR